MNKHQLNDLLMKCTPNKSCQQTLQVIVLSFISINMYYDKYYIFLIIHDLSFLFLFVFFIIRYLILLLVVKVYLVQQILLYYVIHLY